VAERAILLRGKRPCIEKVPGERTWREEEERSLLSRKKIKPSRKGGSRSKPVVWKTSLNPQLL